MSSMIRPIDKNYRKKLLIKADSEDAALAELLGSKFDHQIVKLSRHYFLPSFLLTLIMIMMMKMRMLSGQVLLTQKEQVG